jgi:hypothetical protein
MNIPFFARYLPMAISLGLLVLIGLRWCEDVVLKEKTTQSTQSTIAHLQEQNADLIEILIESVIENEETDSLRLIPQGQQIATLVDSVEQYLNTLTHSNYLSQENTRREIERRLSTTPIHAEPQVQRVLQHQMYNLGLQQNPEESLNPVFLQKCHLLVLLFEQHALQILCEKSQPPTSCFIPNLEGYFSTLNPMEGDTVEAVFFLQTQDLNQGKHRDFRYFINEKEINTTNGTASVALPNGGKSNGIIRTKVVARRKGTVAKMDTFERTFIVR